MNTKTLFPFLRALYLLLCTLYFLIPTATAQNWTQVLKATASDRAARDEFGYSVAISGEYAMIGTIQEDEDANGANTLGFAGSVYVFRNINGVWTQVQKIVPSDRGPQDRFGFSISISGEDAIIGAPTEDHDTTGANTLNAAGAAYIFKNINGIWTETQKIIASDRSPLDSFGFSVAISGDYAIVGSPSQDRDELNSNTLSKAGAAYIFKNTAGTWSQVKKIVPSDRKKNNRFGHTVGIDGDYAAVGSPFHSMSAAGTDSVQSAGAAYIYKNVAGSWTALQKIVASNRCAKACFGWSLDIDEDYLIIGSAFDSNGLAGAANLYQAGSAYIFENKLDNWTVVNKLVSSDRAEGDQFGFSVSISDKQAIVGAWSEDEDTAGTRRIYFAGSAYLFERNAGSWFQAQKVIASDREINNYFGVSVSIDGPNAIVGAYLQDRDSSRENALADAGAAYLFKNTSSLGIVGNDFGKNILVYPNPTKGNFSIDLGIEHAFVDVIITDLNGQVLQSTTYKNSQVLPLSIDGPSACYLISIKAGDKKAILRILKD